MLVLWYMLASISDPLSLAPTTPGLLLLQVLDNLVTGFSSPAAPLILACRGRAREPLDHIISSTDPPVGPSVAHIKLGALLYA